MTDYEWDPDGYLDLVTGQVAEYERLQEETVEATRGVEVHSILELGTGTGETARRLLAAHPRARLHGLDASAAMLAAARAALVGDDVQLDVARLEERLPAGPFDLVVATLAVHHLAGPQKADLFKRIAGVLAGPGRFVLADLIVPADPAEAVTPLEPGYDKPSSLEDQLAWLGAAGLTARVHWRHRDLAVVIASPEARPAHAPAP
jgi:tRNA (cmo5U34)-methyltransferase